MTPEPDGSDQDNTDQDSTARRRCGRGLITDIDRVRLLAGHHDDQPEWHEVAVLLDHVRATLSRDLLSTRR